jgi:hypothetical protein
MENDEKTPEEKTEDRFFDWYDIINSNNPDWPAKSTAQKSPDKNEEKK